jgi:hypothetical protein
LEFSEGDFAFFELLRQSVGARGGSAGGSAGTLRLIEPPGYYLGARAPSPAVVTKTAG